MSTLPKRPHSRSPDTSRRVRQRTIKRSESPEEGEVDEQEAESFNDKPAPAPVEPEPAYEEPKPQTKPKVAFPFKSKAKDIKNLPKADLVNGAAPIKRRSASPRAIQGDSYRPGDRQNGNEDRRSRVDSYVPARDRGTSPKGNYERGRPRSRTPPPMQAVWDAWVNPKYVSERDPPANGRPWDTYSPPRSPVRQTEHDSYVPPGRQYPPSTPDGRPPRRSPSPRSRGEYYRPPYHGGPPPPPERGVYTRRSPSPRDHGLPPRPRSPDRYYPPLRYDDDPRNDGYRGRPHSPPRDGLMVDHYPPRPLSPPGPPPLPSGAPPPLPGADPRMWGPPPNDYYGLPPRPMHSLPPRPNVGPPPYVNGMPPYPPPPQNQPPPARQPAVYNRPPAGQIPPNPEEAGRNDASSKDSKSSSHKVASVWSKEEEKEAYGREFTGSGRLSEYIMMRKLGEGTFG